MAGHAPDHPDSSPEAASRRVHVEQRVEGATDTTIVGYQETHYHYPAPTLSPQERRNRQRLLDKVRHFWVEGVLEQSLHRVALIDLGMALAPEAVERDSAPWDVERPARDQPGEALPPGTRIADVFGEAGRELLILGGPGSGKTTMLLELARGLIDAAREEETLPIPAVFNLSSWARTRPPLARWLADELHTHYQVPRQVGEAWIAADAVAPLLDGLDEVAAEARDACVAAINAFRAEHVVDIAVCSRTQEYEAGGRRLRLGGAVRLQPLTDEQVEGYLAGAGPAVETVRATLRHDPALREMAQSPLMLSILTLAYRDMKPEALPALGTIADRRQHLFAAYVKRMLGRKIRPADKPYPDERTVGYLSWLAAQMAAHGQATFNIEELEPDSLHGRRRLLYGFGRLLLAALFGGLLIALSGAAIGVVNQAPAAALAVAAAADAAAADAALGACAALAASDATDFAGVDELAVSWATEDFALAVGVDADELAAEMVRPDGVFAGTHDSARAAAGDVVAWVGDDMREVEILCEAWRDSLETAEAWLGPYLDDALDEVKATASGEVEAYAGGFGAAVTDDVAEPFVEAVAAQALAAALAQRETEAEAAAAAAETAADLAMDKADLAPTLVTPGQLLILALGLPLLPFSVLRLAQRRIAPVELLRWSWRGGLVGLPFAGLVGAAVMAGGDALGGGSALVIVISAALGGVLFGGLVGGVMSKRATVEARTVPNQGIRQSARNAALVGLLFGIIALAFNGALFGILAAMLAVEGAVAAMLGWSLLTVLNSWLFFGGAAVVKHTLLRLILALNGHIPWNYARFLDYVAGRLLLRKVGGGYIFIHRLLLEHFAAPEGATPIA